MSINRCDRCDRDLMDPGAQYGWRCEKLMRSEPQPLTVKDTLPDLYREGVKAADEFLSRHNIDPSRVDIEKLYEATTECIFNKTMSVSQFTNEALKAFDDEAQHLALLKAYDAFGFEQDDIDPNVFTSRTMSSVYVPLLEQWFDNEISAYDSNQNIDQRMDQVFPFNPRPFKVPINPLMDGFQTGLDIVGLVPGLGEVADGINGGISLLRGNYVDAGLSFASMIPFAGWAASIGKLGKKALKYGDEVLAAAKHVDEVGELLGRGKYSEPQIKNIVDNLKGDGFKNNPLRRAYEKEVSDLARTGDQLLKQGVSQEETARTLNQMRRDLGIKYKDATPQPLREFIYEINLGRYQDPLGPSFEKMLETKSYDQIIDAASKPNSNIDNLLFGFEKWLREQ